MWYSIKYVPAHEGILNLNLIPSTMERQAMNSNIKAFKKVAYEGFRGFVAIAVSLLLVPYSQQGLLAQDPQQQQYPPQQQPPSGPPPAGAYAPLGAEQLNQLVAPIALYPDSLVAQVLTASTYPQQIMDANAWMQQYGGMPPDQRAAAANTMPWDPSIKSLTAFPDVLANLARNQNWAGALGNAYYNQPGDVMNAVQAMRFRAQQAGALRSTPQNTVVYNGGVVVIQPVNPAFVYVPYYNPWVVYGGPLTPWGGYYYMPPPRGVVFVAGVGIGFAAAISIGAWGHYGWGYSSWAPNWRGGVVVYNKTTYISRSTTVINRGNFGGYNRGVYERAGAGVPNNFRPPVTAQSAQFHSAPPGSYRGSGYSNAPRPGTPPAAQNPQGRQYGQPAAPRPTGQASPYARPGGAPAPATPNARPGGAAPQSTPYARPGGTPQQAQPSRPPANTPRPEMTRPPSNTPQNNAGRPAPQAQKPQAQQQKGGGKPAPKPEERR
jgi:hypothetical protein